VTFLVGLAAADLGAFGTITLTV
jgi:hypothetical protein